jgi:hypothetical protein
MSTHGAQDGEKTLYASEDGQVRVTGSSLALGDERWNIDSLASAEVVESKEMKWAGLPRLNSRSATTLIAAGVFLLLGILCSWLAAGASGLVYALALALALVFYILAVLSLYLTWQSSLPEMYKLRLGMKQTGGGHVEYTIPAYVWHDRLQAQSVEQAVLQSIAHKETSAGA